MITPVMEVGPMKPTLLPASLNAIELVEAEIVTRRLPVEV
jgi:hypothetical protein